MWWEICVAVTLYLVRLIRPPICRILRRHHLLSMGQSMIQRSVCKVDELQVNEKKVIRVEDVPIVIYRKSENEFVAFGNKCSHYSAPLVNGVIYKNYVICPWHAACFNIYTGDIEEFPGCNNIPTFETFLKDDEVFVKAPKTKFISSIEKPLTGRQILNRSTFLIIGGGPAGFQCADSLRQEGFTGRIVLVTAEDAVPYDRTKLSKNLASKIESIVLRNEDYFKKAQIEIILNTSCKRLDVGAQLAYFDNGDNLHYEKLFIATGSSPRKYDQSLDGLKNVYYLRTYRDANEIHGAVESKDVVLIGSSFIAIEIACSISKSAKSVSIISRSAMPFARTLGSKIGDAVKQVLLSKGIKFYVTKEKLNFVIDGNELKTIKDNAFELPVDVCICGIGSYPNTEFLKDTNIKMKNSFIEVNEKFETSIENIYAGGDVVIYPNPIFNNKMMNVSHWQTAQAHGRFASFYMLNKKPTYINVPFFWSAIFGKGIRFAGIIDNSDDCLIDGSLEDLKFIAYYFDKENRVIGIATMGHDPMASAFAALLRDQKILTKQDIESNGHAWFEDNFY